MTHEFQQHALSMLGLVFLDAREGNTLGSGKESDIEGCPIRIECEEFTTYPALFSLLADVDARGVNAEDNRPTAIVVKKTGGDPVVAMTLRDFCAFAERNLFNPHVEQFDEYALEAEDDDGH